MSCAYFKFPWKHLGSLEFNRTSSESKLWCLALWLWWIPEPIPTSCSHVAGGRSWERPHAGPFPEAFLRASTHSPPIYCNLAGTTRRTLKHWTHRGSGIENDLVHTVNFPYCTVNFSLYLEATSVRVYEFRLAVSSSLINAFKTSLLVPPNNVACLRTYFCLILPQEHQTELPPILLAICLVHVYNSMPVILKTKES